LGVRIPEECVVGLDPAFGRIRDDRGIVQRNDIEVEDGCQYLTDFACLVPAAAGEEDTLAMG
ncbi:MAG: hypothetical protein ACREK1_04925, partial [Longimicrobiales bacterium]